MAKIEQPEPRISLREQLTLTAAPESAWRRSMTPSIRWGAVIAGVAVALSLQMVLTLLGLAGGLTPIAGSDDFELASVIWFGIVMLAAAFAGGFIAGRMSGLRRKVDGLLHGTVAWAVLILILAALAGYAGGTLLDAVFSGAAPATAQAQDRDYALAMVLRGMIGGDVSVSDVQTLERYVRFGQREEAILLLAAIGMDPPLAANVVDQAMIAASQAQASSRLAASGSDETRLTDAAAWLVLGSIFLSLLSGMGGGLVGALGSQRLTWSKPATVSEKGAEIIPP